MYPKAKLEDVAELAEYESVAPDWCKGENKSLPSLPDEPLRMAISEADRLG
jgi:hypothetical protein